MLNFALIVLIIASTFVCVELLSVMMHKFIFHGPLWGIHETHHLPSKSAFELNDVFSTFFAGLAVFLFCFDSMNLKAVAMGITLYGCIYFFVHDVITHRRFFSYQTKNIFLGKIRDAHRKHHQKVTKDGQGPYGLFF